MPRRSPKSPILEALKAATVDEQRAVEFLERHRWGSELACPQCGDNDVYTMRDRDGGRNKDYRWRCRGCARMFTVRTGTVMEESRLPLRVWVHAFWRACASKKGISALQLAREQEITHKSALFVLRRIRHGLGEPEPRRKFKETVEADEFYHGSKPRRECQPYFRPRRSETSSRALPRASSAISSWARPASSAPRRECRALAC